MWLCLIKANTSPTSFSRWYSTSVRNWHDCWNPSPGHQTLHPGVRLPKHQDGHGLRALWFKHRPARWNHCVTRWVSRDAKPPKWLWNRCSVRPEKCPRKRNVWSWLTWSLCSVFSPQTPPQCAGGRQDICDPRWPFSAEVWEQWSGFRLNQKQTARVVGGAPLLWRGGLQHHRRLDHRASCRQSGGSIHPSGWEGAGRIPSSTPVR